MRLVNTDAEFESAFRDASSEALTLSATTACTSKNISTGLIMWKSRFFADAHGRVVSLGNGNAPSSAAIKKVIEEAPSPIVSARPAQRRWATPRCASRAPAATSTPARRILVDANLDFYFLK